MFALQSETLSHQNNYRFERKVVFRNHPSYFLKNFITLSKLGFTEKFVPRRVNSIYFDTPDLRFYSESVKGHSQRKKVRIRWYGKSEVSAGGAVLELKLKQGMVNQKWNYPLRPLRFDKEFVKSFDLNKLLSEIITDDSNIIPHITLRPIITVHYERKYYESRDKNIRITIDTDLTFRRADRINDFHKTEHLEFDMVIMEIKYSNDTESIINLLANFFPWRISKCSKYVMGINRIYQFSDFQ